MRSFRGVSQSGSQSLGRELERAPLATGCYTHHLWNEIRIPYQENEDNNIMTHQDKKGIGPGASILLVLHSPREKCWGVLGEINAAGVFLRGIDLNGFDDWVRAVMHDEPFLGLADLFFPMWRVERLARDETSGGVPSLAEQFHHRTGRSVQEFFETEGQESEGDLQDSF